MMVAADLQRRMAIGIERYATPLQAHNGRNAMLDAYEELLDFLCYLKQCLVEMGAADVRATDMPDDVLVADTPQSAEETTIRTVGSLPVEPWVPVPGVPPRGVPTTQDDRGWHPDMDLRA